MVSVKLFDLVSLILLLLFGLSLSTALSDCKIRQRRSWYSLTSDEQMAYITGYQKIRKNGQLSLITNAYSQFDQQDTSLFLFYNFHLIYQTENAIRSLGGEYSCFSMPYWDFTIDSGNEQNALIFESGLGADGLIENNFCVKSSNWNVCTDNDNDNNELCYYTPFAMNCATNDDSEHQCCLKRKISRTRVLPTSAQIAYAIETNTDFEEFTIAMKQYSDIVHTLIATIDNAPMSNMFATEDPIFFLLHSFIGYLRVLWTDCNDYDLLPNSQLQDNANAYHSDFFALDDTLYAFYESLNGQTWASHLQDITVRKLYDISYLNIKYDLNEFWMNSKLNEWCETSINNNNKQWFTMSITQFELQTMIEETADDGGVNGYIGKIWNSLKSYGLSNDAIYEAAASLSCDYVRRHSLNSCFSDSLMGITGIGVDSLCESMNSQQLEELSLDDMNVFIGGLDGESNECLMQIRNEVWAFASNDLSVKRALCGGAFDYKCDLWDWGGQFGVGGGEGDGDVMSSDSSETGSIVPSKYKFDKLNTSLWSVIVWCCMFVFMFMIGCYMLITRKDAQTEEIYKKRTRKAHVVIYGAV